MSSSKTQGTAVITVTDEDGDLMTAEFHPDGTLHITPTHGVAMVWSPTTGDRETVAELGAALVLWAGVTPAPVQSRAAPMPVAKDRTEEEKWG